MKAHITRFITISALVVALFVPGIRSVQAEGTLPSGGRPPIPCLAAVVQITSTYILFSNGLTINGSGTVTLSGTSYYSNGNTIQYSDGTSLSPTGTVTYPSGAKVTLAPGP